MKETIPLEEWRKECGISSDGKWIDNATSSGGSEPTPTPSGITSRPGLAPASPEVCKLLCPASGKPSSSSDTVEIVLGGKMDEIKKWLDFLIPLFGSSGKDVRNARALKIYTF